MGVPTDIDDLLVNTTKEKRSKWLWAVCTSLGTVIATTGTVSWQVSAYVTKAEERSEKLLGEVRVIAKGLEKLENFREQDLKELRAELHDLRQKADNALLYAQLTKKEKP